MKSEIKVLGKQELMGKEIRVIEGGFGENQKVMLASDIAKMHETKVDKVNSLVKNNILRFNENDLIDILNPSEGLRNFAEENELITSNRVKNIYLLSERGYIKLVSMMDNKNEKKWEVMDKIIQEYFTMRKVIQSSQNNINMELAKMVQSTMSAIMPIVIEQFAPIVLQSKQQVDNMAELIHDQSEIHTNDLDNIKSLIGFKSSNTKRIVNTIKDMLSERYGYKIYASNDIFVKVKRRVFKRFEVIKWEDIPVERFNEVYAFVDTYIDDMKICC